MHECEMNVERSSSVSSPDLLRPGPAACFDSAASQQQLNSKQGVAGGNRRHPLGVLIIAVCVTLYNQVEQEQACTLTQLPSIFKQMKQNFRL